MECSSSAKKKLEEQNRDACTHSNSFMNNCLAALKDAGCRVTKQRIAVIECLAQSGQPLTAPEVFEILSRSQGATSLDRASVYRALETLHELNLVHRVSVSGAYLACNHQGCEQFHHVLYKCDSCQLVEELDVPNEVVAPLLFHLKEQLNVTPDPHLLQMDGLCGTCSRNKSD